MNTAAAHDGTALIHKRTRRRNTGGRVKTRWLAYLAARSNIWRYRAVAAVLLLPSAIASAISLIAGDTSDQHSSSPWVLGVLLIVGYFIGVSHGFVEQQSPPGTQADVVRRQQHALFSHRAAVVFVMLGFLGVALHVQDTATVVITSAALIAGYINRTCARTGKVATRLATDIDTVLGLPTPPETAAQVAELRRAMTALVISGRSGLDSGLANGWWGLPAVHPDLLVQIDGAAVTATLPEELRERLTWHRRALTPLLDTGA